MRILRRRTAEPVKKTYTFKVFDHERLSEREWERRFKAVNKFLQRVHPDVEFKFTLVKSAFRGIAWRSKKFEISDKTGEKVMRWKVSYDWFKWNYTVRSIGYWMAVAHFSPEQFENEHHHNRLESLDYHWRVGEIVTGKTGDPEDWADAFLHEVSHTLFDHIMRVEDVTHEIHYKKGLKALIETWNL